MRHSVWRYRNSGPDIPQKAVETAVREFGGSHQYLVRVTAASVLALQKYDAMTVRMAITHNYAYAATLERVTDTIVTLPLNQ